MFGEFLSNKSEIYIKNSARPLCNFEQHFCNPRCYFQSENRFLRWHDEESVHKTYPPAVQFSWQNSLAVFAEVHLGPCVYAGLTLRCGHKLDRFATKGWKNLSVCTSSVYIIIVFAKKAKIKGTKSEEIARVFFLALCIHLRQQIVFLLPWTFKQ